MGRKGLKKKRPPLGRAVGGKKHLQLPYGRHAKRNGGYVQGAKKKQVSGGELREQKTSVRPSGEGSPTMSACGTRTACTKHNQPRGRKCDPCLSLLSSTYQTFCVGAEGRKGGPTKAGKLEKRRIRGISDAKKEFRSKSSVAHWSR